MLKAIGTFGWVSLMAFTIQSCGGSSGDSPRGAVIDNPNNEVEVGLPDDGIQGEGRFTLAGQVSSPIATFVDFDVNDISGGDRSNNTPNSAQSLPNIAVVQGFASRQPTASGSSQERFSETADRNDYYRASLQAGQRVILQVADAEGLSDDSIYEGDLDLCLLPAATAPVAGLLPSTLLSCSRTTAEFEEVIVRVSGTYLINVEAFSGISKYILQLVPARGDSGDEGDSSRSNGATPSLLASNQGNPLPFVPGEVVIEYLNTPADQKNGPLLESLPGYDAYLASLQAQNLSTSLLNSLLYKWTTQQIKQLEQQDDVRYAAPNIWRYHQRTPNDPLYINQFHYEDIFLPQAWDLTTGESTASGQPAIVAVIDTGVFLNHPDLGPNLIAGYDFISSPANSNDGDGIDPNPDDPGDNIVGAVSSWHGTHVAGTIAASSNDSRGVAGASWGAKIMPIRVLGLRGGTSFDVIQGMRYAAGLSNASGTLPSRRADILNLSLGSTGSSSADQAAINEIREAGVVIVAAAGNDDSDEPQYPASYDNVISVSAIGPDRNKAPYSSFGSRVDIAAPGGDSRRDSNLDGRSDTVYSTYVRATSAGRSPSYAGLQGTSMATPHVAGVIALMLAANNNLTPADIDNLISDKKITDDAGAQGRDDVFGHGIVNALKAVQEAGATTGGRTPNNQPILASDPSRLSFTRDEVEQGFVVENLSDAADPAIEVSDSAPWLSVTQISDFDNGQARFIAQVNRDELEDGLYEATIQITPNSGNVLDIPVNIAVGEIQTGGELVQQYVVLLDADSLQKLAEIRADEQGNFRFNQLPRGRYRVIAGSDIDVDQVICQNGETCGGFPTRGAEQIIDLNADRTDVDFVVSVVGGGF